MTRVGPQRHKNVPEVVFLKHAGVTWLQYLQENNRTERSERCTLTGHTALCFQSKDQVAQKSSLNTVLLMKQFLLYNMVTCFGVKLGHLSKCRDRNTAKLRQCSRCCDITCFAVRVLLFGNKYHLRTVRSVVKFLVFCGDHVSRIEL
jgi:hypothetical protein